MMMAPLFFLVALTIQANAQFTDAKSTTDAAARCLHEAVNAQRDGSHLPRLFALRQLRDPTLGPLFHQLAKTGDWPMQVHAVLGLAEIDAAHRVDPWLITQVASEAQEAIIANSLDLGLLAEEQFQPILAWDALHPMARMLLVAELVSQNKPVDVQDLARFSHTDDLYHAGIASLLLAQTGDGSAWTTYQSRLAPLKDFERKRLVLWLLEAIGRYRLAAARKWLEALLDHPSVDEDIAYRGVYTLLKLDRSAGLDAWNTCLGENPSHGRQVRYGLALLAIGGDVPASMFDRLQPASTDELLREIIATGKALSAGDDPSKAMITLLDLGHPRTIECIWERTASLKSEQASVIYAHLIDQAGKADPPAETLALAVKAVAKLFEVDPAQVLDRLKKTEDDSLHQQTILLGLMDARAPEIASAAAEVPRIGSGRADSLALLLIARNSATLNDQDKKQLGTIAAGGGRVSDVLQTQAAWLYLKHTGQIESALAAVFVKP